MSSQWHLESLRLRKNLYSAKLKTMTKFVIIIAVLIIITVLAKLSHGYKHKPPQYQYKRKKFFMSRAEHECYDALIIALGEKYFIFPQVHLPSIIDNKVKGQSWRAAFRHINQKSVDFVLCDKVYVSPKLAIELDDRTHEQQNRKDRDAEVERVLKEANLPLLRLENHGHFNPTEILEKVNSNINQG
ncbi:MAG: DUF2726 domain-containing protein [Candidatus Komeilibacteria bacterium]|nr:DUF2726 domain-containing protein [Candidatus Komeilibacteria bacterium]